MHSILVVGLMQKDSGKTTISKAISQYYKDIRVGYAKPVSSFNAWFNYDVFEESLKREKLVSGDVLKMKEYVDDFESSNPVCIMMSPVDPEKVEWLSINYESYYNQISLFRVVDRHFLIEGNLKNFPDFIKKKIEEFLSKTDVEIASLDEFERIMERARKISDRLLNEIKRKNDITIIESTSNVASPNWSSLNSDCVVLISPGKVAIIDAERYRNAIELSGTDPWNLSTEGIIELIKLEITYSTEPKKFDERIFKKISEVLDV